MIQPTYAAARLAADRIHRYLATHSIPAQFSAERVASLPDATTLAALIDAAFWASLRREEGYIPRISLAFVAPGQVDDAVCFAISLSLEPKDLSKLAAAVERVGLHLGVWPQQDELRVWGITRNLPPFSLILEVVLPGLLVVKQSPSEESGKFINIAVIQGDEIKIIDPQAAMSPAYPKLLTSLLRLESQFATGSEVNVLLQLAVSMRTHGRGGMLLVAPVGSDAWNESILQPITYSVVPAFSGLADLMRKDAGGKPSRRWEDALGRAVDGIAGLTAVDGATLISADYKLLAFGAKIVRRGALHKWPRLSSRNLSKAGAPRLPSRPSSAVRATCRRHSLCMTSATRSRWSPRRTAGSRSSPGPQAKKWYTRTVLTRCCCNPPPLWLFVTGGAPTAGRGPSTCSVTHSDFNLLRAARQFGAVVIALTAIRTFAF